jgi:hypothetical protein
MKTNSSVAQKRTPLQEKIVGMLKAGIPDGTVAQAIGASAGYVAGVRETYREEIVAATAGRIERAIKIDDSYSRVEEKLVEKLEQALDSGMVYKTRDLLEGIKVVNGAQRRGGLERGGEEGKVDTEGGRVVINIQLPESAKIKYVKDVKNRVIEVNGRPLVTAGPSALRAELAAPVISPIEELNLMAASPGPSATSPSSTRKFKL